MSRFFAPKENIRGNLIHIDGQEAKHILNVMRLREEDRVVVFDGTGREYVGFIKETRKSSSLTVKIVSTQIPHPERLPEITLAQSLPKREKMDYIVEKVTEIGASAIIPILSERTIVKIEGDKGRDRLLRWRKIAQETAKQCGRVDIPTIKDIQKFPDAILAVNEYDLAIMCCLSDKTVYLKEAILDFKTGKAIVFIGPEGDFTPDEIKIAKDTKNLKLVSLGKNVLKSDTAGVYVLSVLHYEFSQ